MIDQLLEFARKKSKRKGQNSREHHCWVILCSRMSHYKVCDHETFCKMAFKVARLLNNQDFWGRSLRVSRKIKREKAKPKKLPICFHNAIVLGEQNEFSKSYIQLIQR